MCTEPIREAELIEKRTLRQENIRLRYRIAELEAQVKDLEHRLSQMGLMIGQQGGQRGSEVK